MSNMQNTPKEYLLAIKLSLKRESPRSISKREIVVHTYSVERGWIGENEHSLKVLLQSYLLVRSAQPCYTH
jgi:hypothetical protein